VTAAARTSERVSIAGPAGPIEAVAEEPRVRAPLYAAICHPHPLFGGTMDNKVVTTLARALHEVGIATVRFNFRGVGASAGTFDDGRGETADAAAVADHGAQRWPGRDLVLAGFSFGAYVALRLSQERPPSRLITVAPPVDRFDFSALPPPGCPWLVVQGDADEVVNPQSVIAWVESLNPQPRLAVLPGVGHFFHGHLPSLREAVIDAIRSG
jgi:alpha/beta superfamily hydrolase